MIALPDVENFTNLNHASCQSEGKQASWEGMDMS